MNRKKKESGGFPLQKNSTKKKNKQGKVSRALESPWAFIRSDAGPVMGLLRWRPIWAETGVEL